jgi:hypothetical protein
MEETIKEQVAPEVPANFRSTIYDFANDLTTTFPEFSDKWAKWTRESTTDKDYEELFVYCLSVYPQRFFDILNQSEEMFDTTSEFNTTFLPNVDFKTLYHCDGISDKTRETLWKYLQLVLFVMVGSMKDKMDFGDAMNMFEKEGEDNLEEKLQGAMSNIHDFFSKMDTENATEKDANSSTPSQERAMPEPEQLHDHLMGLFDGKIGKLAHDLAADFTGDLQDSLGIDLENITSSKDVLKQLMQNPTKISGLVKKVGDKLNERMSSGEISQQDLMSEAGSMMRKMKEMGGGDMGAMFKNMAQSMGGAMPKGARFDQNAFNQIEKSIGLQEKMRERADAAKINREAEKVTQFAVQTKREEDYAKFMAENPNIFSTDDPNSLVYRIEGETQEKSGLNASNTVSSGGKKKKKKKGKK